MDGEIHSFWAKLLRLAADPAKRPEALQFLDDALENNPRLPPGILNARLDSDDAYHMLTMPVNGGADCIFVPSGRQTLQSLAARAAPWLLQHLYARGCVPDWFTLGELLQGCRVQQEHFDIGKEAIDAAYQFLTNSAEELKQATFRTACTNVILLSHQHPHLICDLLKHLRRQTTGPPQQQAGLALFLAKAPLPKEVSRKICCLAGTWKPVLPLRNVVACIRRMSADPSYTVHMVASLQQAFPHTFRADAVADKLVSFINDKLCKDTEDQMLSLALKQSRDWMRRCAVNQFEKPDEKAPIMFRVTPRATYDQLAESLILLGGQFSPLTTRVINVPATNVPAATICNKYPLVTFDFD